MHKYWHLIPLINTVSKLIQYRIQMHLVQSDVDHNGVSSTMIIVMLELSHSKDYKYVFPTRQRMYNN